VPETSGTGAFDSGGKVRAGNSERSRSGSDEIEKIDEIHKIGRGFSNRGGEASPMKKTYEKPAIIHTEAIEARAVACAKLNQMDCPGGPVTS